MPQTYVGVLHPIGCTPKVGRLNTARMEVFRALFTLLLMKPKALNHLTHLHFYGGSKGQSLCLLLIPFLFTNVPTVFGGNHAPGKIFILTNASRDLGEFRAFARIASRLKPYGRVQVNIGVLADKSWHELPRGGSSWHEYASFTSTPAKFFPHPRIARFYPADWVAKNRALLLAKATVLRELGLEGAFFGKSSYFLPEAFFREHPHLRGPRIDHPRRSRQEEFSWCVDLPETREMIEWMVAELKRHVPEIQTIVETTNDAGGGLCWAAALYSGPNGPEHCRHRNAGQRVRDWMETLHRGARKGGGHVTVRLHSSNFWQNEEDVILPLLPPDTYLDNRDPSLLEVGSLINDAYPVLGLLNPLALLSGMERFQRPEIRTVWVRSTAMYARADEPNGTVEKLVEIIGESITEPARGLLPRLQKLRRLAARWAGESNAEKLLEAFYQFDQAFRLKRAAAPGYSNFYCGVSMRHLTRPLLIKPELLAAEDESYFLPFVFNIHPSEARNDYIDQHGSRMEGPARWNDAGLRAALDGAATAAGAVEGLKEAPETKWLSQLAVSLRMWASEVRSVHNFYFAQLIRDRQSYALSGPPSIPTKLATWTGDPDLQEWNQIQRAEFDNTNELVKLLENGGLAYFSRAKAPNYEDTFVMGTDILGALNHKTEIMRQHWLDAERVLTPPHK